jgi:hypothetical protein
MDFQFESKIVVFFSLIFIIENTAKVNANSNQTLKDIFLQRKQALSKKIDKQKSIKSNKKKTV